MSQTRGNSNPINQPKRASFKNAAYFIKRSGLIFCSLITALFGAYLLVSTYNRSLRCGDDKCCEKTEGISDQLSFRTIKSDNPRNNISDTERAKKTNTLVRSCKDSALSLTRRLRIGDPPSNANDTRQDMSAF
jgi:hypothetical protein